MRLKKPESTYIRGTCVTCLVNPQRQGGTDRLGRKIYKPNCSTCADRRHGVYNKRVEAAAQRQWEKSYRSHKKNYCEECDFVPVHPCQLDVDHMDGNHSNDADDNLRTLCANCHRLKTYLQKDWEK